MIYDRTLAKTLSLPIQMYKEKIDKLTPWRINIIIKGLLSEDLKIEKRAIKIFRKC